MCKTNKANSTNIEPNRIIERICKGIEFLMLTDEQKQEQRNAVAATVNADFETMNISGFVSKYIEWIPTDRASAAMNVHASAVRSEIESRSNAQRKLIPVATEFQRVWGVVNIEKKDMILLDVNQPSQEAIAHVQSQLQGDTAEAMEFMMIPVKRSA